MARLKALLSTPRGRLVAVIVELVVVGAPRASPISGGRSVKRAPLSQAERLALKRHVILKECTYGESGSA
jgi:hypothetical protein